jgi:hypothetical protein
MRRLSEDDLEIVGFMEKPKPVRPRTGGVQKRATPGPKTPPMTRPGASPGAAFHFGLSGPAMLLQKSFPSDSTNSSISSDSSISSLMSSSSSTTSSNTTTSSSMTTPITTGNNARSYAKLVKVLDPSAAQTKKRLTDSPHTKELLKDFYRKLRAKAKESVDIAKNYAEDSLDSLPSKAHWRVYKELADIARRQYGFFFFRVVSILSFWCFPNKS